MSQTGHQSAALELPEASWQPVSPTLIAIRRWVSIIVLGPVIIGFALVALLASALWAWLVVAATSVFLIWVLTLIPRQVRAIGYALRDDDLVIRKGVLSRSLEIIPYGRMQTIEVTVGPLERKFDLASLQFQTASAGTDASLPGLFPDQAKSLRDDLVELGQSRMTRL